MLMAQVLESTWLPPQPLCQSPVGRRRSQEDARPSARGSQSSLHLRVQDGEMCVAEIHAEIKDEWWWRYNESCYLVNLISKLNTRVLQWSHNDTFKNSRNSSLSPPSQEVMSLVVFLFSWLVIWFYILVPVFRLIFVCKWSSALLSKIQYW